MSVRCRYGNFRSNVRYRVRYRLRSRTISTVESYDIGRRASDLRAISGFCYDILRCRLRYLTMSLTISLTLHRVISALYRRYIALYRVKRTMSVRYFSVQRPYIERTSQCSDLRYGHLRHGSIQKTCECLCARKVRRRANSVSDDVLVCRVGGW